MDYSKQAIVPVSPSGTTKDFFVHIQGLDYDAIPSWKVRKGPSCRAGCRAVIDEDERSKISKAKPDSILLLEYAASKTLKDRSNTS